MSLTILAMVGGLVLLLAGAEGLVRGSSALALRLGVTPLLVGLTVVAFGTSSPELVISVKASFQGNGAIALGNVVGSNICNIALILGLAALIRPLRIQAQVVRRELPLLVGVSLLLWLLLLGGRLGRWEGALLLSGLAGYLVFGYRAARQEKSREVEAEFAEGVPGPSRRAWVDWLFLAAGLALLMFGANLFVDGAVELAEHVGMSQAAIGLTVVAVGTSLPELATSVVASLKDEGDLAVGNAVGSNFFNILGILGVAALVRPVPAAAIGTLDLAVMVGSAALVLPLMLSGFRLNRWEGALLLAGYVAYTYHLLP